jgi:hypothetical protein
MKLLRLDKVVTRDGERRGVLGRNVRRIEPKTTGIWGNGKPQPPSCQGCGALL